MNTQLQFIMLILITIIWPYRNPSKWSKNMNLLITLLQYFPICFNSYRKRRNTQQFYAVSRVWCIMCMNSELRIVIIYFFYFFYKTISITIDGQPNTLADVFIVIPAEQCIQLVHFHSNICHSVIVLICVKGLNHATLLTRYISIAQACLLYCFQFHCNKKKSKVTIPEV